jgi:beta-galactosidase
MTIKHNINRGWLYSPQDISGAEQPSFDDSAWTRVNVPHTNKLLAHHNFDDADYQFVSWYRKSVPIPQSAAGERVFLDFDAVMIAAEVFVNGKKVAENKGGYTPFSVELTGLVESGSEALVAVRVDSTERTDIPPFGYVVDYMTFGGIYRDVYLRTCPGSYIKNVFARGLNVLTAPALEAEVVVDQPAAGQSLTIKLTDASGKPVAEASAKATGERTTIKLDALEGVTLWSLDEPYLYNVEAVLSASDGSVVDSYSLKFGFREAWFHEDGAFRLNGEHVKLMGLDRHQMFPYIGQAAPPRLQKRDADILKYDLSLNIVRTSHYPQSPHFLDRCDEIGLLVLEEIPGWQFIGDDAWKDLSNRDVRAMIIRDYNHPSIVLWGVRINESGDDHEFYAETNRIAHELDTSRQTGGIRCFKESEMLEDVFTFNDFSNTAIDPLHTPWLITEYSGHMFPTKTFDGEERKVEHALRHARIQNAQMLDKRIAGAIGWCAFDYNTHSTFGSGDRICYHGVSDIFRLPKWAAHVYSSQVDPDKKVVLELATNWTHGDRSVGGFDPLVIFSNCDTVRVYVGEEMRREFYPAVKEFPGLKHPPFIAKGMGAMYGSSWVDSRVEGYIGGKKVAEVRRTCNPVSVKLKFWADSNELIADGQDMTALNFQIVDKFGNVTPYASEIVTFSCEGPVEIVGTNPFAPQGGQGAVYLKATEQPGKAIVTATTPRLGEYRVEIDVVSA